LEVGGFTVTAPAEATVTSSFVFCSVKVNLLSGSEPPPPPPPPPPEFGILSNVAVTVLLSSIVTMQLVACPATGVTGPPSQPVMLASEDPESGVAVTVTTVLMT